MKIKTIVTLIACFSMLTLSACSSEAEQTTTEVTKEQTSVTTVKIDTEPVATTTKATEKVTEKVTEAVTTTAQENLTESVEEILYESDGIKIVYKGYEAEELFSSAKFKIYIENNSDKNATISLDEINVNGYTIGSLFVEKVPSGKKANAELTLSSTQLKENNIESIGTVEFALRCYDTDTYADIFETDTITITLDDTVSQEQSTDNYQIIHQAENVTVYYTGVTKTDSIFSSYDFGFLVVNDNTDKSVTVKAENITTNDFSMTELFYAEAGAGKKTNDKISVYEKDLEENGIETLEKLEFSLKCTDDSYQTLWETDPIVITVQ